MKHSLCSTVQTPHESIRAISSAPHSFMHQNSMSHYARAGDKNSGKYESELDLLIQLTAHQHMSGIK